MHVESIWQVSPLDALVETISDVCFMPLAGLGKGISAYFNAIIGTTPVWWTPVVLVLAFGLLIVLMMCLMRYRISIPFVSIEPHTSNAPNVQVIYICSIAIQQLGRYYVARSFDIWSKHIRSGPTLALFQPSIDLVPLNRRFRLACHNIHAWIPGIWALWVFKSNFAISLGLSLKKLSDVLDSS